MLADGTQLHGNIKRDRLCVVDVNNVVYSQPSVAMQIIKSYCCYILYNTMHSHN